MDRQEAIEFLLDHYQNPRNSGPLEDADVTMPGGNPGCSDVVTIYLKLDAAGDRVLRMTFEGQGCTVSQAAASVLTELVAGRPLPQIAALGVGDLADLLGREVVRTRPRCATLALDTLKAAIAEHRARCGQRQHDDNTHPV